MRKLVAMSVAVLAVSTTQALSQSKDAEGVRSCLVTAGLKTDVDFKNIRKDKKEMAPFGDKKVITEVWFVDLRPGLKSALPEVTLRAVQKCLDQ